MEEFLRLWKVFFLHIVLGGVHQGRNGIFADYRLRICATIRDYGMRDRDQAPPDSQQANG